MMASCMTMKNLFGAKDREFGGGGGGGGAGSETPSEVSSVNSDWSDLQTIAAELGVTNLEDLYTERFKVDRTKLSSMITSDTAHQTINAAEEFFSAV